MSDAERFSLMAKIVSSKSLHDVQHHLVSSPKRDRKLDSWAVTNVSADTIAERWLVLVLCLSWPL